MRLTKDSPPAQVFGRNLTQDWLDVTNREGDLCCPITCAKPAEIELRPTKDYTIGERKWTLEADQFCIPNFNYLQAADHQSEFRQDTSWTRPLIKKDVCTIFLVTGPANSGKSTYINWMLNQLACPVTYVEADCG